MMTLKDESFLVTASTIKVYTKKLAKQNFAHQSLTQTWMVNEFGLIFIFDSP